VSNAGSRSSTAKTRWTGSHTVVVKYERPKVESEGQESMRTRIAKNTERIALL